MRYSVVCGRGFKQASPTEGSSSSRMMAADYNVLKESPSGHFIVQAETGRPGGLINGTPHIHTQHQECPDAASPPPQPDVYPWFISGSLKAEINDKHKAALL